MPQMMPISWLMIFIGSMIFFLFLSSSWSTFFFLSSFPKKTSSFSKSGSIFWS